MKELAINGGSPALGKKISYPWPPLSETDEDVVVQQMYTDLSIYDRSGVIKEFEDGFGLLHRRKFAIVTSSGTAALHSAYYALGVGPGDEVICPTYTFFATAMPLFQLGALPILADSLPDGSFDPNEIDKLFNSNTKGVVITHMWGYPCDMEKIVEKCRRLGLFLVEDCSHAHGAKYKDKFVGTFSDIAIWSLQTRKIISAGEGGIILTDSKDLYDKAQLLGHFNKRCIQEISEDSPYTDYRITGLGLNYRANPLGIAIANRQLKFLEHWIANKNENADIITNIISTMPGITPLFFSDETRLCSYYAYLFCIDSKQVGFSKETLVKAIRAEGFIDIDIPGSTVPLHNFQIFKRPISPVTKYDITRNEGFLFPVADSIAANAIKLSVPIETTIPSRGSEFLEAFQEVWMKVNSCREELRDML